MSGPHDFAVREARFRQPRAHVHRVPRPTFVTIAKRPLLMRRDVADREVFRGQAASASGCGRLARRANQFATCCFFNCQAAHLRRHRQRLLQMRPSPSSVFPRWRSTVLSGPPISLFALKGRSRRRGSQGRVFATGQEGIHRVHSGNPAFRRPSINSFEFACPPRAINADIVNAGSTSSRCAAASRASASRPRWAKADARQR